MTALVTGQRNIFSRAFNGLTTKNIGHGLTLSKTVTVPTPGPNELLVKVHAVAINPTDFKHSDILAPPHAIIGCDYAGIVETAPPDSVWEAGDRIAGAVHGGMFPDKGSFAQYLRVKADLALRSPNRMTDVEASTLGVSIVTSMMALYYKLDLPWPDEPRTEGTLLVYSGATATGLMATQLAKKVGWGVVTTCSPHSFELSKKYGADACFDYRSATAVDEIKKAFPDITRAMDCFSEGESTAFCKKVIGQREGKVVTLLPDMSLFKSEKNEKVKVICIMAYTLLGEPYQLFAPLGPKVPAAPEDRAALVRFCKMFDKFFEDVMPPPIEVVPGGFDVLQEALDMSRKGKVSGKKLVVELNQS